MSNKKLISTNSRIRLLDRTLSTNVRVLVQRAYIDPPQVASFSEHICIISRLKK